MTRAVDPMDAPWTCGSCGSERPADDRFCGVCAAPRRLPPPAVTGEAETASRGSRITSTNRSLILGAAVLAPLVIAIALSRPPSTDGLLQVSVEPTTWRCDGSQRAWSADLSVATPDIVIQLRSGDAGGAVATERTTTLEGLGAERTESGGYRVVTTDTTAPECSLAPGTYALVILDASSQAMLAAGQVDLQP